MDIYSKVNITKGKCLHVGHGVLYVANCFDSAYAGDMWVLTWEHVTWESDPAPWNVGGALTPINAHCWSRMPE